ncbi:sensor histidine kinase, partial [Streptomyces sp. BH055]
PVLGGEGELVLFRVVQESLTNVARHAGAGCVEVVLEGCGGVVVLTVSDDGRGVGVVCEGAGVRGMRERALLIGADLEIVSVPGVGTRVRLTAPVSGGQV